MKSNAAGRFGSRVRTHASSTHCLSALVKVTDNSERRLEYARRVTVLIRVELQHVVLCSSLVVLAGEANLCVLERRVDLRLPCNRRTVQYRVALQNQRPRCRPQATPYASSRTDRLLDHNLSC